MRLLIGAVAGLAAKISVRGEVAAPRAPRHLQHVAVVDVLAYREATIEVTLGISSYPANYSTSIAAGAPNPGANIGSSRSHPSSHH